MERIMKQKVKIKLKQNYNEITLKTLYEEHILQCKARKLSKYTFESYQFNYQLFSEFLGEDYPISQLSDRTIHDFISFLEDNYSSKPTTVNSRLRYVRCLLNFAYEQGYCDKIKVRMMRENRENKNPLTQEEVQKLIVRPTEMKFTEMKMWVITNLVLSTGIRSRNVREVRVNDLNLQDRTLYLRDTKSHKPQTIYLSQSIIKILNEWLKLSGLKGESPLFSDEYGDEMTMNSLKMAFIRYCRKRGVKTSLHILRHTYARDLITHDINPVIVKELLGHQNLNTTMMYVKLFSDDVRKATNGLDTLAQYQKNKIKLER